MSHVTHENGSCYTYEWVMYLGDGGIMTTRIAAGNQTCDTHE